MSPIAKSQERKIGYEVIKKYRPKYKFQKSVFIPCTDKLLRSILSKNKMRNYLS